MQQTEKTNGYKKTKLFQVRLDYVQYERLQVLASASGYKSVSDYARTNLLSPDVHDKLNRILQLLEVHKGKGVISK